MCYDMLCGYQDWMGDCTIHNHQNFEKKVGCGACALGGGIVHDPEEQDWYERNRHNIVFQYLIQQGRRYTRGELE